MEQPPLPNLIQATGEEVKETLFPCDQVDPKIVKEISETLLSGLATACVDHTTGDLFRTPLSVAASIREEMEAHLFEKSKAFVSEHLLLDDEHHTIHPQELVSEMVDEFSAQKKNILSRVSGWVFSESREDKIDDFIQAMDLNRFWAAEKREATAVRLVRNVDFRRLFHCGESFSSEMEAGGHREGCVFKRVECLNGCGAVFSAGRGGEHQGLCSLKAVLCEQGCGGMVRRGEMDKHCVTVCSMRMVKCPFFSVGCGGLLPYSRLAPHFSESLRPHCVGVLSSLRTVPVEEVELRFSTLLESISLVSSSDVCEARDVRSLASFLRGLELRLESSPQQVVPTREEAERGLN